jgi:hypothetical protein
MKSSSKLFYVCTINEYAFCFAAALYVITASRSQRGHHYYFDPEIGILPYARQPSKTFHFDVYD